MRLLLSIRRRCSISRPSYAVWSTFAGLFFFFLLSATSYAHGVAEGDKGYIQEITGVNIMPFVYLGAKHMFTGYDHILFLLGVIFFLYKLKHISVYVSLFAIGHSSTMLLGVYFGTDISAYLIDAIIGLSVVYKALDNIGAFQRWFGVQPNTKAMTLVFGLFHGFGLATKIQDEHSLLTTIDYSFRIFYTPGRPLLRSYEEVLCNASPPK